MDENVAKVLNHMHEVQAKRVNKDRREMEALNVGTRVWYKRPEGTGEKLDSRWIGPGIVRGREGDKSYLVEVKPGVEMKAHRSFLKPHKEPLVEGRGTPLYFHRRTEKEEEAAPDEWEVEKILSHRKGKNGKWEFLTKWVCFEQGEETWEPVGNFIHRFSEEFLRYCGRKRFNVTLMEELQASM